MELKYAVAAYIGIFVAVVTLILAFLYRNKKLTDQTVKLANSDLLFQDKYIKRQMIKYYIFRVMLVLSVFFMIIFTAYLLARPYYIKRIKEQKYNRDIILCMDISSSVNDLNVKLVSELQNTVRSLSGERIGIVIFNTTPVVLSPLTDDYEYTIEQLENIKTAIKSQKPGLTINRDNWLYWNEFLYGGTTVGSEIRGSSLIGDGLLGGLFAFPDAQSNRAKIIIFSTDNDPQGEGFVELPEAAEYCKRNNVTVYGIGTKLMYTEDMAEMKQAVESTGGKFFVEENASEFHQIVDEIESKSEELTEGKTIIKLIESPERYFILLVICFIAFIVLSFMLRRQNVIWCIGGVAMAALLVLVYLYAVVPAKQFSKGPDLEVKRKSNLNVLFIVDDTLSMLANDADGTRLDKVKNDLCLIVDELEGAQFSVITFNNDAMLLAPFSKDSSHVKNAINSMYPIRSYYANGSSLDTPKELALTVLKKMKANNGQKTAVFYVSDGEITAEGGTLTSFAEFSRYTDFGAVLGYGTSEGGTMTVRDSYSEEEEEIMDYDSYPFGPAVSRIDEDNLKAIAKDMGVDYIYMNDVKLSYEPFDEVGDGGKIVKGGHVVGKDSFAAGDITEAAKLTATVSKITSNIVIEDEVIKNDSKDEYITPPVYYGFYALVPFAVLVMLNAAYIIRKK